MPDNTNGAFHVATTPAKGATLHASDKPTAYYIGRTTHGACVSRQLTFSYDGNRYLIEPDPQARETIGKFVVIETDIDGNETFGSNDTSLSVALG